MPSPAVGPDGGTPTRHAPKPQLPYGLPISNYSHDELVWLIRWIESDTLLRTEEDLLNEVMDELGYQRRGHGSAKQSPPPSPMRVG